MEEINHLGIVGGGPTGTQLAALAEAGGYVVHRFGFGDEARVRRLHELPIRLGTLCICAPDPPGLFRVVAEYLRLSDEDRPACLVNMTPVGPMHARRVDALLHRLDPTTPFAEVAFSGGANALREREATVFYGSRSGSPDSSLERLLYALSARVIEFGSVAEASAAKLVCDVALALTRLAVGEAFAIGLKSGLTEEVLVKVLASGGDRDPIHRDLSAPSPEILSQEELRLLLAHASERDLHASYAALLARPPNAFS